MDKHKKLCTPVKGDKARLLIEATYQLCSNLETHASNSRIVRKYNELRVLLDESLRQSAPCLFRQPLVIRGSFPRRMRTELNRSQCGNVYSDKKSPIRPPLFLYKYRQVWAYLCLSSVIFVHNLKKRSVGPRTTSGRTFFHSFLNHRLFVFAKST